MTSLRFPISILSLSSQLRSHVLRTASLTGPPSCTAFPRICSTYATYNTNARPADSSVNQNEVSHFTSLAASWWDPQGPSRLLHLMDPLRHQFIRRCLHAQQEGDEESAVDSRRRLRYLDIGCGGGIFAESAARLPSTQSVTAIDPTAEVIAVATRHQCMDPLLMQPGLLEYRNCSIEQMPHDAQFDIVSLFEVIEHIRSPSAFLRSCLAHVKPGGWLVGSTIARTNVSWFTTKFMAEEVLRMVPKGTHEWSQYIHPRELKTWARAQADLESAGHGLNWQVMGVVYVPGVGWKVVSGSEDWGNYFFAMQKQSTTE